MRRILLVTLAGLLFALPSRATFTLIQHNGGSCTSCTSLNVTMTQNFGSGHLIIILAAGTNGTNGDISSATPPSIGGTWVIGTSCHATNGTVFGLASCAWVLSSTSSGTTTESITFTASNNYKVAVLEYSFTGASVSLDTSGTVTHTSSSTSQAGVALTLTGSNDVIAQGMAGAGSATVPTISAGYTVENTSTGSGQFFGGADAINTVSGSAPTWTTGNSSAIGNAVAFKETGSSKPPGQFPRVY